MRPGAAVGLSSPDHPLASATFTVGISEPFGGGSSGLGPIPAASGSLAPAPHALTAAMQVQTRSWRACAHLALDSSVVIERLGVACRTHARIAAARSGFRVSASRYCTSVTSQ